MQCLQQKDCASEVYIVNGHVIRMLAGFAEEPTTTENDVSAVFLVDLDHLIIKGSCFDIVNFRWQARLKLPPIYGSIKQKKVTVVVIVTQTTKSQPDGK